MASSDPSLLHTLTVTLADNVPCGEAVAFPSLALLFLVSKGTAVCAWLVPFPNAASGIWFQSTEANAGLPFSLTGLLKKLKKKKLKSNLKLALESVQELEIKSSTFKKIISRIQMVKKRDTNYFETISYICVQKYLLRSQVFSNKLYVS